MLGRAQAWLRVLEVEKADKDCRPIVIRSTPVPLLPPLGQDGTGLHPGQLAAAAPPAELKHCVKAASGTDAENEDNEDEDGDEQIEEDGVEDKVGGEKIDDMPINTPGRNDDGGYDNGYDNHPE